jgi:hypothetical protein
MDSVMNSREQEIAVRRNPPPPHHVLGLGCAWYHRIAIRTSCDERALGIGFFSVLLSVLAAALFAHFTA